MNKKNTINIPFSKVVCNGHELDYVRQVLESGWLTTASKTLEFERQFAEQVCGKYACAVTSCTAAMHLALEALGVSAGTRVFVPTLTFTATAEVIRYLGGDPILLDVDYGTRLLTPDILESALKMYPDVQIVLVVHFGGQAARMMSTETKGITEICEKHGVKIVEDAAHAFPARCQGHLIGGIGEITCFSFYANKTITTGEGGMLVTNNKKVYQRAKIMRLHGINRDIWNRFVSTSNGWEYDVVAPGFKYNMPDINAAIGLAQLERAKEYHIARRNCAAFYYQNLANLPGLDLPVLEGSMDDHAWHLYTVVLNEQAPINRDRFIELLAERGIGTSVHYKPLHRMKYYRERYNLCPDTFPSAERYWRGCVSLPIYPSLSCTEQEYIVEEIRRTLRS